TKPIRPLAPSKLICAAVARVGHGEPWVASKATARNAEASVVLSRFRTTAPIRRPAAAKKFDPAAQQTAVPSAASSPAKRMGGGCDHRGGRGKAAIDRLAPAKSVLAAVATVTRVVTADDESTQALEPGFREVRVETDDLEGIQVSAVIRLRDDLEGPRGRHDEHVAAERLLGDGLEPSRDHIRWHQRRS